MKNITALTISLIIAISIALIIIFFPSIYDNFIWKYLVGPIIADAVNHPVSHHGIEAKEGYTIVSEGIYATGLIAAMYGLYLFFEKFGIIVDTKFFISSLPFILLGSFGRVLEDTGLFKQPFSYFFISPLIYAQIGIYFFFSILFGVFIKDEKKFTFSAIIIFLIYLAIYIFFKSYFLYLPHPLIFLLIAMFSIFIYYISSEKDYNTSMLSFGLIFFLPAFFSFIAFCYGTWGKVNFHPAILLSILIATIIAFSLYGISKFFKGMFHNFINSSTIFSHSLDAFTTYMAVVNPFKFNISYGEKHPIPAWLMKKFYGLSYPIIKIGIILIIIYSIDELKENLKNTIKFFILFLGLSPGLRDLLRILIGV